MPIPGTGRERNQVLDAGDVLSLLALSGGEPVDVFGEWDGFSLTPLSLQAEGTLVGL